MTITFASDGEELRDSVDVFNLLVQQKEMLGEERVMSWLCQELVRGLSEVEGIQLGESTDHLDINGVSVLVGLCLRDHDVDYIQNLVYTKNESTFLILVQLPNEYAYEGLYFPFMTSEINEEWELCHVARGLHGTFE